MTLTTTEMITKTILFVRQFQSAQEEQEVNVDCAQLLSYIRILIRENLLVFSLACNAASRPVLCVPMTMKKYNCLGNNTNQIKKCVLRYNLIVVITLELVL